MGYLQTGATHGYYSSNLPTNQLGKYQYLSLNDIIDNFTAAYVGEGKILGNVLKADVSFHAHRALAELSYDTLKSCKSQEITLPPSLQMILPQDYVNYIKLTWSDANGIEHVIYPTSKTSNPQTIQQNSDGEYLFDDNLLLFQDHIEAEVTDMSAASTGPFKIYNHGEGPWRIMSNATIADESPLKVDMEIKHNWFPPGTTVETITHTVDTTSNISYTEFTTSNATIDTPSISTTAYYPVMFIDNTGDTTWGKYKSSSNNQVAIDQSTTTSLVVDNDNYFQNTGQRYGLDGQYAQTNGSFFIDCNSGKIHFSSNISGKTVILHYLSDNLGTDDEMVVPKLAEEAIYKWIAYGCLSARADTPEYVIARFKKEKYAETRKAKLRLSNVKIEEITQIIRGKNKWIKH